MNPYALLDEFSVEEAVRAITGIVQPKTPEEKNTARITVESLRRDIGSGSLKATVTEVHGVYQERIGMRRIRIDDHRDHRPIVEHPCTLPVTRIARADLLAWCEARGIRPPLLFPDSLPAEKPLHASERQTLLAIIRALAELNGIKPNSGAYRKEADALLAELSRKCISLSCNVKTLAKHLKEALVSR